MRRCLPLLLLWCLASTGLYAVDPAFDLAGPKVDVHVKRGEVTLPIGEVPNLMAGDRLWIHSMTDAQRETYSQAVQQRYELLYGWEKWYLTKVAGQ